VHERPCREDANAPSAIIWPRGVERSPRGMISP
jgi:hypothetical protein